MDLEIIILSEISQKERDKYHMISPIQKTNLWLPQGKEGDKSGILD